MKNLVFVFFLGLLLLPGKAQQPCLLNQDPVHELVQDYAKLFTHDEHQEIEQLVESIRNTTSTEILVLTVTNLCGIDKADFTITLADKWGVGQKGKDNGLVIMIKPKTTNSKGETFIATGYGLESNITDAQAARLVHYEMIPEFEDNNYFKGVKNSLEVINEIITNRVDYDSYRDTKKSKKKKFVIIIVVIGIFIWFPLLFIFGFKKIRTDVQKNNVSWFVAYKNYIDSLGRGYKKDRYSNHNYEGSASAKGTSSNFGGGSFGGGGAGGSW